MRAVIFAAVLAAASTVAHADPDASAPPADPQPAPPPAEAPPEPTPPPVEAPPPAATEPATTAPAEPTPVAPAVDLAGPPIAPPADTVTPSRNKDIAWLFVGGALTFVTAGAVLAYSTSSAEQDIKDLYVATGTRVPDFDADTKRRYDALIDEGERYQTLSWTAFGIAAACAVGATVFFVKASHEPDAPTITPVVTPTSAGVNVRF